MGGRDGNVGMGTWGVGGGSKSHKQTDGCSTLACSYSKGASHPRRTARVGELKGKTGKSEHSCTVAKSQVCVELDYGAESPPGGGGGTG